MFYLLVVFSVLLVPKVAFGHEVFAAVSGNPYSDRLEDKDYGSPEKTGGTITALGVFWSEDSILGMPLELRLQRAFQTTAWNDNKETGEVQYRDGYRVEATEVLVGYRWALRPSISMAILLGGGRSEIAYETRENHDGGSTHSAPAAQTRHLTTQMDFRYILPFSLQAVEFGLVGMLRLSAQQSHTAYDEVSPATWSINFPTFPIPSLGVSIGVKL
jgi:hypothetical protein